MSEWDFEARVENRSDPKSFRAGKWDVALSATTVLVVSAVSFLVAWATREIPSRPFWLLGCCFAAPVAALMLSVFLKERISSTMTPSTSRKSQFILVMCSILAAFVVGCCCQVTNEKADTYEEVVVGKGWSDLLIILDKSGSMESNNSGGVTLDKIATDAVIDLVNQLDDNTKVGILIDVGWEENNTGKSVEPLSARICPIASLTEAHRREIRQLVNRGTGGQSNFTRAFQVVSQMINEYDGDPEKMAVLLISDGVDITKEFRASAFKDQFADRGIKVNYLYVTSRAEGEVSELARMTGGESIYASDQQTLLDQMQKMAMVPVYTTVYKDALRDLDESTTARIVTGILLLLLGGLIGISLTIMLSVQGQKRFQTVLSPLMAACAFAILVYGKESIEEPWIREAIAFSLFGIVLMRENRNMNGKQARAPSQKKGKGPAPVTTVDEW